MKAAAVSIRIENLFITIESVLAHLYGDDIAVFIKFESVYADTSVVAVGGSNRMSVIHNEILILSRVFHHRMVSGTCAVHPILFKNLADSFERSERTVGNCVCNTVI